MKYLISLILTFIIPWLLVNLDNFVRSGKYVQIRNSSTEWKHGGLLKGISGRNFLKVNKYGLKGPEFGQEKIRVLAIGNSLTEGIYLDSSELWTQVIEDELRAAGLDARVFNAGKSGSISSQRFIDIYEHYEHYNFDFVILYPMGIWNPNYKSKEAFSEIYVTDFSNDSLSLRNNSLVNVLRKRKWDLFSYFSERFGIEIFNNKIANINNVKEFQFLANKRSRLPVLPLSEVDFIKREQSYEKGVKHTLDYFINKKVPVLFMNRLHILKLSKRDQDHSMWWGDTKEVEGKMFRYSKNDYDKILKIEDKVNLKYGNNKNIYYLGDEAFNADLSWFYDHHHLNESGSREFAKSLSSSLLNYFRKNEK